MPKLSLADLQSALKSQAAASEPAPDGTRKKKKILVKEIFGTTEKSQKGTEFELIHVEFRDLEYDKLSEKKIPIFKREQAEVALSLVPGSSYELTVEKVNGYWEWKEAVQVKD